MFEDLIFWCVIIGIAFYVQFIFVGLLGWWYWFWHKHRADRATYETTVTARGKCHPQFEGRGQSKIQALRKLEAAVIAHDVKERAR